MRPRLVAVLLLLLGPCVDRTACQDLPADELDRATRLFGTAALEHGRDARALVQARGLSPSRIEDVALEELRGALAYFERSGEVGVLFYDYDDDGGLLRIWLIDQSGVRAFREAPVSRLRIAGLIEGLRRELGVQALQATRVPSRRGLAVQAEARWTSEEPGEEGAPLVDRMSVSIAPSLFDVVDAVADSRKLGLTRSTELSFVFEQPLIVGNPAFPDDPEYSFPPLPGAEAEARAVAALVGTTPLTGSRATKDAVLGRLLDADFLFFATHGVADAEVPLDGSFLVLGAGQSGRGGRLTAREIQTLDLGADLAVLSGCQTGLGMAHDAGIIGLARAFQLAGVRCVVVSLWSIDDRATADLMRSFAALLEEPQVLFPAPALRRAMLEARKTHPNPAQWASFVLFGVPF